MMTEGASTSEKLVNVYQTMPRNKPEDSHFHTCRLEDFKSHDLSTETKDSIVEVHPGSDPKKCQLFFAVSKHRAKSACGGAEI
jgi:hypothetical protein